MLSTFMFLILMVRITELGVAIMDMLSFSIASNMAYGPMYGKRIFKFSVIKMDWGFPLRLNELYRLRLNRDHDNTRKLY